MRVRLLNNGGYVGLGAVEFPVEVEGRVSEWSPIVVIVSGRELSRVGASDWNTGVNGDELPFIIGTECEVVDYKDFNATDEVDAVTIAAGVTE